MGWVGLRDQSRNGREDTGDRLWSFQSCVREEGGGEKGWHRSMDQPKSSIQGQCAS